MRKRTYAILTLVAAVAGGGWWAFSGDSAAERAEKRQRAAQEEEAGAAAQVQTERDAKLAQTQAVAETYKQETLRNNSLTELSRVRGEFLKECITAGLKREGALPAEVIPACGEAVATVVGNAPKAPMNRPATQ